MDYTRFLNRKSLNLEANPLMFIGEIARKNPDIISMANGRPDPDLFPFKEATFTLLDGSTITVDHPHMKRALQYSESTGFQELVQWFYDWQIFIHSPPVREGNARMACILDNGSLDGIYKSLACLVEEGDSVLMEQPAYPGPVTVEFTRKRDSLVPEGRVFIALHLAPVMTSFTLKKDKRAPLAAMQTKYLKTMGNINAIPVYADENGLNPKYLRQVLSQWKPSDATDSKSNIPKLLYCTPSCANPTGVTMPLDRKKEIYHIAREYNLLILEDDAYFYLQFTKDYTPSFLSIDVDGRVLRLDSLSKILAPGLRVGLITGPWLLIEKILYRQQASTNFPSGLAQMMIYQYLKGTGQNGFKNHLDDLRQKYKEKRDRCVEIAKRHLTGLAEWNIPNGGSFLWLKLLNIPDCYDLATVRAVKEKFLVIPGKTLMAADKDSPCPYIRVSYAKISEEDTEKVFTRLASLLKSI